MYKHLPIGVFSVPTYSVMIIVGLIICNLIAQRSYREEKINYTNFLLIELLGGIGAITGAKLLTFLKLFMREGTFSLSWNGFIEAGYSYYGGLAGFFIVAYLFCKKKKIDVQNLARDYLYLLPLLHAFWKVGCLLGGCCFGKEYNGPLAIVYPPNVNIMSGISVFPSPLIEAIVSLVICLSLLLAKRIGKKIEFIGLFFILYGTTRFFLEFFRYHDSSSILSDGQINSLICGSIGLYLYISKIRRMRSNE